MNMARGGVRRGAHGHDPQGDRPVVVGRDVTPVVGMQVQEIIGGLGPGKRPEEVCAGERTGTIRKVIGRLSAQSEKSTTLSCGVVWEEGADMQVRLERTMCCCSAAAFVPDLALSPACPRDANADVQAFRRGSTQLKKTGLGGNFELLLSPLDPLHPAHTRARSPPRALAAGQCALSNQKEMCKRVRRRLNAPQSPYTNL
jgi:hypothetical protein